VLGGLVAHENIEPTQEMAMEIDRALFSMEAMVAFFQGLSHSNGQISSGRGDCRGVPLIAYAW
jgi:hypothetical protein